MKNIEHVVQSQLKNDGGSAKNMIRDYDRGRQRKAEDAMADLLDELHIRYIRQYHYSDTRRFRADFALPAWLMLIEIVGGIYPFRRTRKDGSEVILPGAHGTVAGIKTDCERLNEASLSGYMMLRFLPEQVRDGVARKALQRLSE